jgi:chromosome segregation ATPase
LKEENTMASTKNFRSALNGFNREDVVHYIEYLNAKHNSELQQLTAEMDLLRNGAAAPDLSDQLQAAQEEVQALRSQLAEKTDALDKLQERFDELRTAPQPAVVVQDEEEVRRLQSRCEELEAQLQAARAAAAVTASHSRMEQELETYRRAERTEREARERAQQAEAAAKYRAEEISRRANGALADATVKVEESFAQLSQLAEGVNRQLSQLQQAVTASRQVLSDASHSLYTINTNDTI